MVPGELFLRESTCFSTHRPRFHDSITNKHGKVHDTIVKLIYLRGFIAAAENRKPGKEDTGVSCFLNRYANHKHKKSATIFSQFWEKVIPLFTNTL